MSRQTENPPMFAPTDPVIMEIQPDELEIPEGSITKQLAGIFGPATPDDFVFDKNLYYERFTMNTQTTETKTTKAEIEKITFKQCTLTMLEKRFGLEEVDELQPLTDWLNREAEILDHERQQLLDYQQQLADNFRHWNETELAYGFIGPLMSLVKFSGKNQNFFAVRPLSGRIGNVELGGKPDGMIASGKREPEQPYF
ncbi:MAG: hypothetical protein AAF639_38500 [Chloroflexota bacterium]